MPTASSFWTNSLTARRRGRGHIPTMPSGSPAGARRRAGSRLSRLRHRAEPEERSVRR
jgi:hypothetical protein